MRFVQLLVVPCLIGAAASASAGIYIPAEPLLPPIGPTAAGPFDQSTIDRLRFLHAQRRKLAQLGTARAEADQKQVEVDAELMKFRSHCLDKIAELEAKEQDGELTVEDRVDLSGYYLRLFGPGNKNRAEQAIKALNPVAADGNFMVLCNLAMAWALSEQERSLDRACQYLEEALKVWPNATSSLDTFHLNWYFRAEKLELKLFEARRLESKQGQELSSVDNLFPILRREWAKGYTAGPLRAAAAQQLPADAIDLVTLLTLWMPHDDRLYWLLAELENAVHGNYEAADLLMTELDAVTNPSRPAWRPEMHEHVRVWELATEWTQVIRHDLARIDADALYFSQGIPLSEKEMSVAPLTWLPLPEGAAPMLQAVGFVVAVDRRNKMPDAKRKSPSSSPPPVPEAEAQPPPARWTADWKYLVVSFATGALISMLVTQQWRQYKKRRQMLKEQEAVR